MNTATIATHTPTAAEPTPGWNAMPAYGEVMTELHGLQAMDMPASSAPAAKTNLFMESFWSCVRSQFLALAA
ncbi:MAG: hypothetical protein HS117_12915 [Verrucomicrobiaceae bacterium]|jgi:hypothetical protein|nr:hypothetical protein [Verrucomicrobiaceae bacterium]MBE7495839.1 hypothetical protein [Verrucomicrobiaceae bacterium]